MIRIETRELVSPADAAARIGISTRRLLQLVREGHIPAIANSGGWQTFRVEDVDQLRKDRQRAK